MRNDLVFPRLVYILALILAMFSLAFGQETKIKSPYLNSKLQTEARVQDLLNRMSIEEKIAQLQCEIQEVDGGDSIITKGLGNLAISLRPLGPREAAEKANRIQKLAIEKTRLGLFENPYVDPEAAAKLNDTPEHRALALRAAREAIVLLKNENNFLPLKKDLESIAVIGPNADAKRLGGYSGFGMKVVTVLEGIKNRVSPTTKISYTKGCDLGETALPPIPAENLYPPNAKKGKHG